MCSVLLNILIVLATYLKSVDLGYLSQIPYLAACFYANFNTLLDPNFKVLMLYVTMFRIEMLVLAIQKIQNCYSLRIQNTS